MCFVFANREYDWEDDGGRDESQWKVSFDSIFLTQHHGTNSKNRDVYRLDINDKTNASEILKHGIAEETVSDEVYCFIFRNLSTRLLGSPSPHVSKVSA